MHEPLLFLGHHAAEAAAAPQQVQEDIVRIVVQFLHFLAMHVRAPDHAEDVDETRAIHGRGDHLRGEADLEEDVGG